MKRLFLLVLGMCSSTFGMQEELERAIAQRDSQKVQTIIKQLNIQHDQTERSPLLQTIGRGAIKTLYDAADRAEQEAGKDAETRFNRYVAARIVKAGCCATGVTYQVVKLAITWKDYRNWTEMAVGVYLGIQGFVDFYQVITNNDAKTEYAKTQIIKRSLQDLHENIQKNYTVSLSDLEEQRYIS